MTSAPIVRHHSTGNIDLAPPGANTWYDVEKFGTASARNLDIVFPGAVAGQTVELQPNLWMASAANGFWFDFWSIVDGVAINHLGVGDVGPYGWIAKASVSAQIGGMPLPYTLQAADIEDGCARFRLRYRAGNTTLRTILAAGGLDILLIGRGPYDPRPQTQVVFDGQSHNQSPLPDAFPEMVMAGRTEPWLMVGRPGTTYAVRAPSVVDRVDVPARAFATNVYVVTAGSSDLRDGISAVDLLVVSEANAVARRAADYDHIIVATVPPARIFDVDDEAQRVTYNEALRSSTAFGALIDFDTAPELADCTNLTYYQPDQTHWTAAGAQVAADVARLVLLPILGG